MKPCSILFTLLLLAAVHTSAQEKSKLKFGKVSADDFKPVLYVIDSSADAVIIGDIGSTEFVGNEKGGFALEFKHYRRAHILNKNGYSTADIQIPIYTDGDNEEELLNLKAVTYNLVDGKVVETRLDPKSGVFRDKISKNLTVKKFTFPDVREGSIIEYEYKLKSDFMFNLQPWEFQGGRPVLWSEYSVAMPEFFNYVTLTQGYQPFYLKDTKDKREMFTVTEQREGLGVATDKKVSFSTGVTHFRWVMKDVPALKEESYTSTLRNHIARIEFQLAELREPVFVNKKFMSTWTQTCEDLLSRETFGKELQEDNTWLDDAMQVATKGSATSLEKARGIYSYVRDNMSCTNYSRRDMDKTLRAILKSKSGNEAEINLLLTAMLQKAGLNAQPVLLSTRGHGYVYALYPLIDRFNYVITRLTLEGKTYFLDASRPRLGFGRLGYECYNGHARVVEPAAGELDFRADSLVEKKLTSLFVSFDQTGQMTGNIQQTEGYYGSYNIRNQIKEKGLESVWTDITHGFGADARISSRSIDSADVYEAPVQIRYSFSLPAAQEDILYVNPLFGEALKENPFKSAKRLYPVEMPYTFDQTYLLSMNVPAGYEVDELPRQIMVKLNEENDGHFEYRISVTNGQIMLRSRIRIGRAFFDPEEYDMLREFFNLVVKKHGEQIVLKKKK